MNHEWTRRGPGSLLWRCGKCRIAALSKDGEAPDPEDLVEVWVDGDHGYRRMTCGDAVAVRVMGS